MSLKILIVDDVKAICNGIVKMIHWEECGYSLPETAYDGFEALEKMKKEPFSALLTDVRLPEMSGLELCSMVQKKYPDCKILIMSGYSEFEYARSAINLGAITYLLKPVSENELSGILKRLAKEEQLRIKSSLASSDETFYMGKVAQHDISHKSHPFEADFSPLVTAISQIDEDAVTQEVDNFIQILWENCPPESSRHNLCYAFVFTILNFISEIGEPTETVFGKNFNAEDSYIASTIQELHQKLTLLCRIVLDFMIERKKRMTKKDIIGIAEYINRQCHENLTVMQLGELFHLNHTYLGRKFKSITGKGIKQYLNECRIERAKDLLVSTTKTVTSISLSIGYMDFDYFCNLFKKRTRVTPVQYRSLYGKHDKALINESDNK